MINSIYPNTKTSSRPGTRSSRSSSNSTLSSSLPSSDHDKGQNKLPKRPESVRERIIRERKAKKISSKIPVTPPRPATSKKSEGPKQPLHVALRKSASAHGPRAVLANKIKQQAHFSAVKNFQVCVKSISSKIRFLDSRTQFTHF